MSKRSLNDNLRKWKAEGWTAERTGGGHIRLQHPNVSTPIFTGSTPSDWRSVKNVEAMMRRELRLANPEDAPVARQDLGENRTQAPRDKKTSSPTKSQKMIQTVDIFARERTGRKFNFVNETDVVPIADPKAIERSLKERRRAWALAILHLRAANHNVATIRLLKKRFVSDAEFSERAVQRYRNTSEAQFNALRTAIREGKPLPVFPNPHPASSENQSGSTSATHIAFRSQRAATDELAEARAALAEERRLRSAANDEITTLRQQIEAERLQMRIRVTNTEREKEAAVEKLRDFLETKGEKAGMMTEEQAANLIAVCQKIAESVLAATQKMDLVLQKLAVPQAAVPVATVDPTPKRSPARIPVKQAPVRPQKIAAKSTNHVAGKRARGPASASEIDETMFAETTDLARRLRSIRMSRGMSQQALGAAAGVTGSMVSAWELRRGRPTQTQITKMADALDVRAEFLLQVAARP